MAELVSTWFGTFLVERGQVVRSVPVPDDPGAIAESMRRRRAGSLTAEEERLLAARGDVPWTTRDRRLVQPGVTLEAGRSTVELPDGPPRDRLRAALLADAERALAESWDPSIHVEEAVRAEADLDRVRNLVGERLGSWASRDAPELDPGDHDAAVAAAMAEAGARELGPGDPGLLAARRSLAELYRAVEATHRALAEAIAASVPRRTPNLNALLGPDLSARLLSRAGGLDRLARLPSSTIQVLGAERAFFEHLRGRAPPPRHGEIFLHPALQSAPRNERGKLARALAGKIAIAARLDQAGAAIDPSLGAAFDRRRAELSDRRSKGSAGPRTRRSRPPLDRASRDR